MENIILIDTQEKANENIIKAFEEYDIKYIRSPLNGSNDMPRCDYTLFKNYDICIDVKQSGNTGILELCANMCHSVMHHNRTKEEISTCFERGAKRFIFLIADKNIHSLEEVKKWVNNRGKVQGEQLYKTMVTMAEKYKCEYIFTSRKEIGTKIIDLLN